jgi:hypothetical protein
MYISGTFYTIQIIIYIYKVNLSDECHITKLIVIKMPSGIC